ncbi:MAG: hypothetical protein ACPLX7_06050 [Candidatus Kapaibacteriota bacterium]
MEKESILKEEEQVLLFNALRRLICERKPIYEGYQKYLKKEKEEETKMDDIIMSKEGQ